MRKEQIVKEIKKGIEYFKNNQLKEAEDILNKVVGSNIYEKEVLLNLANIKNKRGDYLGAIKICDKLINNKIYIYSVFHNKADCLQKLGKEELALQCYEDGIKYVKNKELLFNLANLYRTKENYIRSIDLYNEALELDPKYIDAINNKAVALYKIKRYEEALKTYNDGLIVDQNNINLLIGLGIVYYELNKIIESIKCYERVLRINIKEKKAYANLGNCFRKLKKTKEAKKCFEMAIRLDESLHENYFNLAQVNIELNEYDQAISNLKKLKEIKPDYQYIDDILIHSKLMNADWFELEKDIIELENKIIKGEKVSNPFTLLTLTHKEDVHLLCARLWNEKYLYFSNNLIFNKNNEKIKNKKIIIGLYSPDIYFHPVTIWLVEIIERMDRNIFELHLFSYNNNNNNKDEMHLRIKNAVDYFYECDDKSDEEIINLSREKIDIALDLGGFTSSSRPTIFAKRICNKQINLFGFPGSTGSNFIDYIIADNTAIPEESMKYYSEKIKYIDCIYTYDTKRKIYTEGIRKEDLNLPADSIVLTCQNGIQKIQPRIFSIWMSILAKFPTTYLMLQLPGELAVENLRNEAKKRGIMSDRIKFLKREIVTSDKEYERISRYLSDYKIADLFLDTYPYNAGTTAVDALFAGLPLITIKGKSQVGRMASSALHAIGFDELIADTFEEYENIICQLLTDKEKLKILKEKLRNSISDSKLFDIAKNIKNLETALIEIYQE